MAGTPGPARGLTPFAVLATVGIVGGGLLAAATAHAASRGSAWATAYLVLVVGVAQLALGAGQALLATRPARPGVVLAECVLWNTGSAGVIAGTLLHVTILVDVGAALLLVALALFTLSVRGGAVRRWQVNLYRLLVLALLISVLVGVVLARTLP